jgi:multicomponent Na+:H+ antiporter subunit D
MFMDAAYETQTYFFYIGAITGLFGVVLALAQKDLKQVLAYHTVSQIGLMMMGLSYKEGVSFYGGFLHIINHAMFKSLLFLVAGRIIYHYGTKKISMIKGVFKTMPFSSILLIVGMLSISGMPFFNGYVSKTLIKYAFKDNVLQMLLYTLINIGTVASFVKFSSILFGEKQKVNVAFKDSKRYLAMTLLALVSLLTGIFYQNVMILLFNYDPVSISLFNLSSWIDYFLYVGLGIFIYRFVIKKDFKWIQSLRGFSMSFEDANYALILYMSVMILLMYVII